MPGSLVCLEGIDGSGKATQAALLYAALARTGVTVSCYSYPDYGSLYGRIIRDHMDKRITLGTTESCLMFAADMSKDAASVRAKLSNGEIVIIDRYFISTVAYQSSAGLGRDRVKKLEEAICLPSPSLVIYLDLELRKALERKKRQKGRLDRHEEDIEYLGKVRAAYEELYMERYTGVRWVRIDAGLGSEEIHRKILAEVIALR